MTVTALPLSVAVDPSSRRSLDLVPSHVWAEAACASARAVGIPPSAWTPEREAESVPQLLDEICRSCPVRVACLRDAVLMNDIGYRASTTTADRRRMFPHLTASVPEEYDPEQARPLHAPGEGSLSRYRRGCRCSECRGSNAAARRRERAKAG